MNVHWRVTQRLRWGKPAEVNGPVDAVTGSPLLTAEQAFRPAPRVPPVGEGGPVTKRRQLPSSGRTQKVALSKALHRKKRKKMRFRAARFRKIASFCPSTQQPHAEKQLVAISVGGDEQNGNSLPVNADRDRRFRNFARSVTFGWAQLASFCLFGR